MKTQNNETVQDALLQFREFLADFRQNGSQESVEMNDTDEAIEASVKEYLARTKKRGHIRTELGKSY